MPNTYLDNFDYARSTSGMEYQTLVGNAARFTTAQTAAATSLTVPASGSNSITVQLNYFDRVTILDGSSTEVVQVGSAGAAVGATSIPLLSGTSLAFNHAVGVAWCSDGAGGSLADQIINASTWIETQCNQPLLQTTWTNELLAMPSMRASVTNRAGLHFRPRHWPVTSLTALSIATQPGVSVTYDPTQVFIDSDKQVCSMPYMAPPVSGGSTPYPSLIAMYDRTQEVQLSLTYQAGYAYGLLPGDLKEAVILVVSDFLAKRYNPLGADSLSDSGTHISAVLRGDLTGESLLIKRAMKTLIKYSTQSF
jgi:hypothetical protein